MKVGILSMRSSLYSTRRIQEAAAARGHEVFVVDYRRCYMNITSHNPTVMYQGETLNTFDAVIPRIAASRTSYGTAVVRQFEMGGVYSANGALAISRSRDKLRTLQILSQKGIGMPVTSCAYSTKDIEGLIQIVGGAPLVVKLLEGTQGNGVVLAETRAAAESVISAFIQLDAEVLVQEFIREAKGADIRCFIVGDKVVASMKRQGKEGEFRSNLHRGGHAEKVRLTPEERTTAVRAAKAMNLKIAGVDLLRSNHGPVVLEVNSSPGLEGIEKASGIDVADHIIRFVERAAREGRKDDRKKG